MKLNNSKSGSLFHKTNLNKTGLTKTDFNLQFFYFSVEQSEADRVHHLTSQISTKMVQGFPEEKLKKFTTPVKVIY